MSEVNFEEIFPIGAKVLCESEMSTGKWKYGEVKAHLETRYGVSWAIRIQTDDGALVDYDYRYLDVNPHNSLVRLVKLSSDSSRSENRENRH